MKLNPTEVRAAYFLAAYYRRSGQHVPPSVAALWSRLEVAYRQGEAVTRSRQHNPTAAEQQKQSTHGIATGEQIGSRMVSAILGRSPRWVHRHATDLHGRRIGR